MSESRKPQPAEFEPSAADEARSAHGVAPDVPPAEANEAAEKPPPAQTKRRKKGKKRKNGFGADRGIDTLFRTAYREQLDLTSLADSKANIMIQLNAIIVSIMLASSGVVMKSHAWLRLPSAALTFTALVSIVFAVLAARPNLNKPKPVSFEAIRSGKANILFFGNFARISEEQFVEGMWEMFDTRKAVYLNMTRHVHGLGTVLLRKFRLLRIAYTVFLSGLFVSALLFMFSLYAIAGGAKSATTDAAPYELSTMFEPSGVIQLPDGRILVVEDEPERPMALFTLNPAGVPVVDSGLDFSALLSAQTPLLHVLDDLEAATYDPHGGFVYAITSFSAGDGPREGREKLLRFKLSGSAISEAAVRTDLGPALRERAQGELNIEGMAYDEAGKRLLLGLRTPLCEGKTQLIPLDDPQALFGGSLRVGEPILLEMDGEGVRGMAYDAHLGGLVIIGHREGSSRRPFNLWLWKGQQDPQLIQVTGANLQMAEGVTPVVFNGQQRLLIVNDDGKRNRNKTASYQLLRYDQLSIGGS